MKYTHYTEEDFIMDEYFQKWILDDNREAQNFWENWLQENPAKKHVVDKAAGFIKTIHFVETSPPSENEVNTLFKEIVQIKNGTKWKATGNKGTAFAKGSSKYWTVAACVGALVTTLVFHLFWNSNTLEAVPKNTHNEVTLKLEDGTVRVLHENTSKIIRNSKGGGIVNQDQNLLIYNTKSENKSESKYNELVVPYGKKFELRLSDNTHVLLNSGSKLRYPTVFVGGVARTVYLDGEAYFSVEKDKGSSFVVVTEDINIKVYGTKFNVSSYKNEKNTSTVLVEGSIGVYKEDREGLEESRDIVPGERAEILDGNLIVNRVNVEKYVAWTEGKLYFVDDKFELILKKLERQFNVTIENKIEELNDKRFTGTFTEETIGQIFKIFQEHTPFEYSMTDNRITLYRKE